MQNLTPKDRYISLLKEIIEAGATADRCLDMGSWFCETSCCACGDVAFHRFLKTNQSSKGSLRFLFKEAQFFAEELTSLETDMFEDSRGLNGFITDSIIAPTQVFRLKCALKNGIFEEVGLKHPHLNENHSDRAILHDFINLTIKRLEEVCVE